MSPRHSRRRRRRVLAAPFVITAASLATSCVVKSEPPRSPEPTRYDQNGNEVTTKPVTTANPAGSNTGTTTETTTGTRPTVISNPPAPETLPDAPKDGKGSIQTRDDGTCWYYVKIDCPANAACNPPPPQQVKCEADG